MANLPSFFKKDFSGGMATNLNENLAPENTVGLLMNMDADEELGSVVSRLGTGIIDAQLVNNETVLGVHDFRDTDGANHALIATINATGGATSVVYKVGTGTIVTGLTADTKMRFLTFLDSVLMLNGADGERSYDGASVITTGGAFDLANLPGSNCEIVEEFLDRVYVAGDSSNPDRLYYSSIPTSGAISWTSGNGNVDIEVEDGGGGIKALSKVPGYLLIFKERSMKRWNFSSAFPESLVDIGTPSQESVIKAQGLCAFFSASSKEARGFYITNGSRPIPISHDRAKMIKKWVDAIPQAFESNISGFGNERFFAWSIGDVTVDGIDYTNIVVRWNRTLDQWSVRSYPSEFRVFSSYVDGSGNNVIVGGDDDGNVIEVDKASTYTDYPSNTPINWEVRTQPEDWDFNQKKEVSERIIVKSKNTKGASVNIIMDGETEEFSQIDNNVSEIKLGKSLKANEYEFSIKGVNNGARAVIKEIEVPNIEVLNSYD